MKVKSWRKNVPALTYARLREVLNYDPVTGCFTWLVNRRGGARAGCRAGYAHPEDHRVAIGVDGRLYRAYRLAWFYMTGEWPPVGYEVEHKDTNSLNDSWDNLRLATRSQNAANARRRAKNTTGFKGVTYDPRRKKYAGQIGYGRKTYFLGYHDTPEAAHVAYCREAKRLYGEYARVA